MKAPLVFEKFIRVVKAHALLDRGDRLVVAVSGGADSVALLSLLLEVRAQFELELIVAHLNHNLRGKSSEEDQEFVRTLAHRFGIRFICEKIKSEAVIARRENLENWAREQRYAFLSKAAGSVHAQKVALGHTMSDQAETFLMRLLRGSGTVGLSAMSHKRDGFIRPLLSIERHEILAYLKVCGVTWREDASNLDTQFLRNRLRQELIPSLKDRYNPKIVSLLAGTAAIVREESEALRFWAAEIFEREAVVEGKRVIWDMNTLVSLPIGLQKRLIRLSLESLVPGDDSLSAQNVASIMHLLGKWKSGKFVQTGLFSCFREFNCLCLEAAPPAAPQKFCYALRIPGRVELPQTGTCFEARLEPSAQGLGVLNRWELFLSRTELEAGFCVRNWEPADVYFEPGSDLPKKVATLFAQRKVPRRCRNSWPVVVLGGRVVCLKDFPFCADNPVTGRRETRVVVEERSQDL
ncbi:MAG: tRNA lysidine(34) synthetase TilS [Terriglobia bacterium]